MRNRRNNNIKELKDYIVPIVTFLLIFTLIYFAIFWGGDDEKTIDTWSEVVSDWKESTTLYFEWEDTEAVILDVNEKKTKIVNGMAFQQGHVLKVSEGYVSIKVPNVANLSLYKNWKLGYDKWWKLSLDSSSLWIKSEDNFDIDMRFAKVKIWKKSILNLEQNEAWSTIYLINGSVEIENLGGSRTFLSAGQKIKILNKDASKEDADLSLLKEDIDDFFKVSDWYLQNNKEGENFTDTKSWEDSLSGALESSSGTLLDDWTDTVTKKIKGVTTSHLLSFDSLLDEGFVNTAATNISGVYTNEAVHSITIQGKAASINRETKTFNVVWVDTSRKSNDIAIKVYNEEWDIMAKYLYTLNYAKWGEWDSQKTNRFAKINTSSYPVNNSDFLIAIPTVKNGKTLSSENTFYGTVKNPDVAAVLINGYKLSTYNGKTFRYHAYKRFKTLWEWINNYEIKYIWRDGKVILKKYITINKKKKGQIKKVISNETKAQ